MRLAKYNISKDGNTTSQRIYYTATNPANAGTTVTATTADQLTNTHYIFGQPFNGTQDVEGELNNVTNINATGIISGQSLDVKSATTENLQSYSATTEYQTTRYFKGDTAVISSLTGDNATVNNLNATSANTQALTANTIASSSITNSDTIYTKNLEVTGQAHFFKLIIDEIKSVGGQLLITAANAKIDMVRKQQSNYQLLFRSTDPDGREIDNQFVRNDQIICQTFNVATGTTFNAANKYYWALVNATGNTTINGVNYHYITISDAVKDGDGIPEAGDEIAQLGYRGTDDVNRQNAIIISAYNSPDPNVEAPSIVQYRGINSFSLEGKIMNQWASNGNIIRGNLRVESGENVEDLINSMASGTTAYLHIAYADNMSGSGFTTNPNQANGKAYLGMYSDYTPTGSTNYRDYTWMRIKGDKGDNYSSQIYTLFAEKAIAQVGYDDVLSLDLQYKIKEISGNSVVDYSGSNLSVWFRVNNNNINNTFTQLNGTGNVFTYYASSYIADYHNRTDLNNTITVLLTNGNPNGDTTPTSTPTTSEPTTPFTIYEENTLPITFKKGALFEVREDAINLAVQNVQGDINTISATATANTASIRNLSGQTNQLQQTADALTLNISNLSGDVTTISANTENIVLQLNQTGINIENGKITLNANNTDVLGNLNLKDSSTGLIIYDAEGNPKVIVNNGQIGTFTSYSDVTTYDYSYSNIQDKQAGQQINVTVGPINLGTVKATDRITISGGYYYLVNRSTGRKLELPTTNYSLQLLNGNVVIYTLSGTLTRSTTTDNFYLPTFTATATTANNLYLNITITANDTTNTESILAQVFGDVARSISNITHIGTDGIMLNQGQNKWVWLGTDELRMQWQNDGYLLNDNGLQRIAYNNQGDVRYFPLEGYHRIKTLTYSDFTTVYSPSMGRNVLAYTVTDNDDLLYVMQMYTGSTGGEVRDAYIILSNDSLTAVAGRTIKIKNNTTTNIHVICDEAYTRIYSRDKGRDSAITDFNGFNDDPITAIYLGAVNTTNTSYYQAWQIWQQN